MPSTMAWGGLFYICAGFEQQLPHASMVPSLLDLLLMLLSVYMTQGLWDRRQNRWNMWTACLPAPARTAASLSPNPSLHCCCCTNKLLLFSFCFPVPLPLNRTGSSLDLRLLHAKQDFSCLPLSPSLPPPDNMLHFLPMNFLGTTVERTGILIRIKSINL